jgi:1-acyl-sn-glycerol-3-phosphate acyltransferase
LVVPDELFAQPARCIVYPAAPDDVAFLQYTSGSTGQPKGVVLTHANLLANIRAMGNAIQVDSTDVFVSWLPLYHDMGLIGAWLGSLFYAVPLALMSPLSFLSRPSRWLQTIHRHRGTLTAAPNFAYELCLNKIQGKDLEGLDLSSLRLAFNGAEPVSPTTVRNFCERLGPYGFRPQALAPVYGLAEAAVGLAFPPLGRSPVIDRIRRAPFTSSGRAIPADSSETDALEFVSCGQPLPGYQIRIVDAAGRELPERRQGRLEFKGPSATRGYHHNAAATEQLFDGQWLDSSDLAYIAKGEIYMTGRVKDVIIRGGRNIYPVELEEAAGDIPGIRKGCVAVFGSPDPETGTERVIIVAETREQDHAELATLQKKVQDIASDILGMPPDDVVITGPHSVLKTSSGKIRHAAVRERYEQGKLGKKPKALWFQLLRLVVASWRPQLRRAGQRLAGLGYALYTKTVFWLLAPPTWIAVMLLPPRRWRWAVMRYSARSLFHLTRVPIEVSGIQNWSWDRPCVIVANHASYLDGVVLVACLPGEFSFVAKAELASQFIAGHFLRRIGAVFVERFDMQRGVTDARRLEKTVGAGQSLMFFPEGTLTRMPGLLPFHMGAFVAAAEAGIPVLPVSIHGTRSILRSGSWFPHRGDVSITIKRPLMPLGKDWSAAVKLRDRVRDELLSDLDEPDLSHRPPLL